jgi:hypothetical protein
VCELHFDSHDIERTTSFCVEATGERLTAPLKIPRLVQGNFFFGTYTYIFKK